MLISMKTKATVFFEEKMRQIFRDGKTVIDIGGGLRIDPKRNNRFDKNNEWLLDLIKQVDYRVMDKVAEYSPDIVGDIHELPFADNSIDVIICSSVLEHVEEPQRAVREMYRVLKPGGVCFIDVPFLFYYHPMKGYYHDFYRFTADGIKYMARDFSSVELCTGRGAAETVLNLFPFFSKRIGFINFFDRLFKKDTSNQTSNYLAFCIK